MKKNFFIFLFFCFTFLTGYSQNLISVPFTNGFVGDNTANNSSSNAYYLSGGSGLGWSNIQFTQNSSSTIFVAQGNDIIGTVLITDSNGTEHSINGFIKWRTPSGNSPTTPVFEPQTGTNITFSTNSFNGSSTYTITDTKYIGLTFNGSSLSISPVPGTVSGNAATSGLLDTLNDYLALLPKISIQDKSVNENAGSTTVTVSLSVATSNTVTVNYTTVDGTALAGSDYTTATGTITFGPNETTKTIPITILDDNIADASESFSIVLSDATNAAILDGTSVVSIIDNECTIPNITVNNVTVNEGDGFAMFTVLGPLNSFASLQLQDVSARGLAVDYGSSSATTNLEYSSDNGSTWVAYQDFVQFTSCSGLKVRTPIILDNVAETNETFKLLVKPLNGAPGTVYNVNYQEIDLSGLILVVGTAENVGAEYLKTNAITINSQVIDAKITITAKSNVSSFTFDNDGSNPERFQSEINSTSSTGSFVDYKLEFFLTGTNTPAALTNFYVTGVDIDGSSSSEKEYIEISNFSSYTVNNPTGLTIGVSPNNPNSTRFLGINTSLSGITFENSASFIANFESPLTELVFRKGNIGTISNRQFSMSFGDAAGTFSTPNFISNNDVVEGLATIVNVIVADPTKSTITASPTSIVANGTSTSTITIQLKDSSNANLTTSGGTVLVTTSLGTLGTVTNNNNGTYTVVLTSSATAGTATIGFSINGTTATNTTAVTFTAVAITADPTKSTITASPTSIVANGTSTSTITIQLKDSSNANLTTSGGTVLVTTSSGTLGTVTNNNNGTYTVVLTSSATAGTATIGFSINGTIATNTTSVIFTPVGPDSDGDGILDANDLDDDNDGILDTVENAACTPSSATCDTDGDGIINSLDLDSDNDGITDAKESNGTDANGDGRIDGAVDSDGIPVSANGGLTPPDTDTDGSPNPYDLDSDNDGLFDVKEANGIDANNDGKIDGGIDANGIPTAANGGLTPPDTDGDGAPDYRDLDSDNDGISDADEKGPSATPRDTDGDGTPDYRDLDSDNDGISDADEKGPTATPRDTDGDGVPDYRDLDSDNDGISDADEKGPTATPRDTDGDGVPDYRDLDSDNDGISDADEKGPSATPRDTDGDGVPDYRDLDSDNDGISDADEKGTSATPRDTDGDGVPDYRDLDSDNDGISDADEKGPSATPRDTDGDGVPDYRDLDSDNDGISDAEEKGPNATPRDTDGDGVPDYRDLDSDNDGISDADEKGTGATPKDTDGDGIPDFRDLDADNDGIADSVDNCPLVANPNQSDNDKDGLGDDCDPDDDNDGVFDTVDNCPLIANANQADRDRDGQGDVCDTIELNVAQAITPNGDGDNDTWVIYNIENHPGSIVRVFNRWGKEVFYSRDYKNDWDGHYKDYSDSLPTSGSYYYQIDLGGDGTIDLKGWLYITK
jgi:gliding motility-associated-like protein